MNGRSNFLSKIAELLHWSLVNVGQLGMSGRLRNRVVGLGRLLALVATPVGPAFDAADQSGQANTLEMGEGIDNG
jgi:hypothetical protein